MWATSVPILVFLSLSILNLGPMFVTERQTSDVKQTPDAHHRLMPPALGAGHNKLTFDLLTLKVVSESRATSATSVPILVFLGLSVLDLGPMYATDRQTS